MTINKEPRTASVEFTTHLKHQILPALQTLERFPVCADEHQTHVFQDKADVRMNESSWVELRETHGDP